MMSQPRFNAFIQEQTTFTVTRMFQILSGTHLPKPEGEQDTSDLVDPYVKLEVFGVKEDCCEYKTQSVNDNGKIVL